METIDVYLKWNNPDIDFLYKNIVVFRSPNKIDPDNLPKPIKVLDKKVESYVDPTVPLDAIPNYAVGCLLYNDKVLLSNMIDVEYIIKITNEEAVDAGGVIEFDIFGFGNKNGQTIDLGLSASEPETLSSDDLESNRLIFTFVGNKSTGTVRVKDDPVSAGGTTSFSFSSENRSFRSRNSVDLSIRPFSHRFTNAGATGRFGPSLTQCRNEYSSEPWVLDNNQFTVSGGIQIWTVPTTGTYRITAAGAQGGGSYGGYGALIRGDFELQKGTKLNILVGQTGETPSNYSSSGGGGGTFVYSDSLLVAAGGGGGCRVSSRRASANAAIASSGKQGGGSYIGAGGRNGAGGEMSYPSNNRGGGGAGFLFDAKDEGSGAYTAPATCPANGGIGGIGVGGNGNHFGGFGGGGGATSTGWRGSGGGGGYSGGGGGQINSNSTNHNGGGGGSFNSGDNQDNHSGVNTGHGYVEITRISITQGN